MITAHKKENLLALYPGSLAYPSYGEWIFIVTSDEVCYTDLLLVFLESSSVEAVEIFKNQKDLPAIAKLVISNHRKGKNEKVF